MRAVSSVTLLGIRGSLTQRLCDSKKETSVRPKLRRTDSDARAIADLIFLIERIDDIDARA